MRTWLLAMSLCLASNVALAQSHWVSPVRVRVAPPAIRVETRPAPPSGRHQWIAGYWAWRSNSHVWVGGHWALPPQPGYVWEPADWVNENGSWVFYEGHWRAAEEPDPSYAYQPPSPPVNEVVVDTPPPAPLVEVRTAIPFAGAIWVPGYWHWNGHHHAWVSGRWSASPAGHAWEEPRWEKRGDGRYTYRPGHWHPH